MLGLFWARICKCVPMGEAEASPWLKRHARQKSWALPEAFSLVCARFGCSAVAQSVTHTQQPAYTRAKGP